MASVTDEDITQRVAGAIDGVRSYQCEVLDIGAQRVARTGANQIKAFVAGFHHHIGAVVHQVQIITCAPLQRVHPCTAVQSIVGGVAGEHIVQRIAGAVDGICASQGQVFNMGAQRVTGAGLNQINAFVGRFHHNIRRVIHNVGVVARTTDQCVNPEATNQSIRTCTPIQNIVARVSKQCVI